MTVLPPSSSDGKAGTVEIVPLEENHGLRISIRGHEGSWPVSTIKFAQGLEHDGFRSNRIRLFLTSSRRGEVRRGHRRGSAGLASPTPAVRAIKRSFSTQPLK